MEARAPVGPWPLRLFDCCGLLGCCDRPLPNREQAPRFHVQLDVCMLRGLSHGLRGDALDGGLDAPGSPVLVSRWDQSARCPGFAPDGRLFNSADAFRTEPAEPERNARQE